MGKLWPITKQTRAARYRYYIPNVGTNMSKLAQPLSKLATFRWCSHLWSCPCILPIPICSADLHWYSPLEP